MIRNLAFNVFILLLFTCMTGTAQNPAQGRPRRPPAENKNTRQGPAAKQPDREPAVLDEARFRISFGRSLGKMKPLLGINAGPAPSGEKGNADVTEQYRLAGVQEVRTQDFYGPLDMSVMYPDFSADPSSPESYDFSSSDKVFSSIVKAGIEPYFRIGDSYNNARIPKNGKEMENYIRASVKVIQHYKKGWKNGFNSSFRHVEIGNEPDNKRFWPGRYEDFFTFFAGAYRELKKSMPDLELGGPGFVVSSYKIPSSRQKVVSFLEFLKGKDIKPDFISFHLYSDDPSEYYDMVQFYRRKAEENGMVKAELHVSEWNTEKGGIEMRVGPKAAPYVTACWIALHQAGADASYLFRGNDTNIDNPGFYGIFHADGRKKPAAYAFQLWSRIAKFSERIELLTGNELIDSPPCLDGGLKPVWMLGAGDGKGNFGLLISNIGMQRFSYDLSLQAEKAKIEIVEFEDSRAGLVSLNPAAGDSIILKPLSIQLISVTGK